MFFNRPSSLAVSSANTFDSTPPSVIGTVPFSGGTEVALDSTIQVNFSEPILSSSVNSLRFYVKENGSVLEGTIKVQSDKIYFTPKLQLLSNRVYSVTVGSEIEDGYGNRMGSDYSFQFTSARMDSVPPSVVTVSPSDGTLGVSQNAVLTVLFSEEIDPSSILKENILAVDEVGTPIQLILSLSGNILTIAPADKFTSGSRHTVTLRSQLRDLSQNTMNGDFIFQFYTADPERPYLVDTQPKNGDKNFDPRYLDTSGNSQISPVKIVFNELITSSSVNPTSFQVLYSGTPVAGNVTSDPDGKTFYFTPSTALNYNSQYTAIVTSAVSDLAGNTMLRDYTFQFYTSSFVNIVVGNNHACAQLRSGKVKCWGDNSSGQLGIGSRIPNVPSPELSYSLDFGSPVTKITAGTSHNCVLLANGGVKCWGDNSSGQLGNGNYETIRDVSRLLLLPMPEPVIDITSGPNFNCAIFVSGKVKCWGDNYYGQLGDGTGVNRNDVSAVPSISLGGDKAVKISAGTNHVCVILDDGNLKCWGANFIGQLGYGDQVARFNASAVSKIILNTSDLRLGSLFTCAESLGKVFCWGSSTNIGYARPYHLQYTSQPQLSAGNSVNLYYNYYESKCYDPAAFGAFPSAQCTSTRGKLNSVQSHNFTVTPVRFKPININSSASFACSGYFPFDCWGNVPVSVGSFPIKTADHFYDGSDSFPYIHYYMTESYPVSFYLSFFVSGYGIQSVGMSNYYSCGLSEGYSVTNFGKLKVRCWEQMTNETVWDLEE